MVPWSRLLLLHVHGLRARRYGLWASQGQESSKEPTARTLLMLRISPRFFANSRATRSALCSLEKTQSLISPYTCYGLRALRYGWSAMVPWSRLFLLHMHGLHTRRYRLWASQDRELSEELTARTPLILHLSPRYFANRRAAHVPLCSLWRRPRL